jgi:cytosine/adenosine deaminase-related metal-dependent hydrolase
MDVLTALKAMTIWPAWQHFEEQDKGSIEVGKRADFVILSADPTAVDPERLADLDVLVTIKEDRVIHEADGGKTAAARLPVVRDPEAAHHLLHAMHAALAGERGGH